MVQAPEPDEDGEPISTMVVDWVPAPPGGAQPELDPWAQARRQDQRTAGLRLKRVLMGALADQGVELPILPNRPSGADDRSGDRAGAVLCPHAGRWYAGAERALPAPEVPAGARLGRAEAADRRRGD